MCYLMIPHLHYREDLQPQPPVWADKAGLRSVIAEPLHSRVSINCRAVGQPRVEVRWTKNGIPVEELTSRTFNSLKVGDIVIE